ncbi:MAG: glycosyltransferase [Comamonadaceae bacterium]|nr:MAG: glycosyltransferase [Comamonadaceae bacterium]
MKDEDEKGKTPKGVLSFFRSSGVTVAIRRIHEAVQPYGVENYFVNCGYGGDGEDDLTWQPPGRIENLPLMSGRPATVWRALTQLKRLLDAWNIDVIHVHHRRLSMLLTLFSPYLGRTLLYSGNLTYKFSLPFWLLSPARAVAVTQSVKENILSTTRTRDVTVLGNPTPFPDRSVDAVKRPQRRAVCVARFAPVKGHATLIEAWKTLRDRGVDAELVLIGEGPLRQALEDQCRALGLSDRVAFRGYTADVRSEYEAALFAVLVSAIEGQGIVTIEAAAAGRASLLTDVDGSRDCLPPDRQLPNAVPFGDPARLADALFSWFADADAVVEEGKRFRAFHQKINSSQVLGRRYADVYQSALRPLR